MCITCVRAKLLQLCPTFCNPMDCGPPGSSVNGILQASIGSGLPCPPPGDLPDPGTEPMSLMSPVLAGRFFTTGKPMYMYQCVLYFVDCKWKDFSVLSLIGPHCGSGFNYCHINLRKSKH